MGLFRKKEPTPSPESVAAREAAEASLRRAEEDLAESRRKVDESQPLIDKIREHNEANHYDRWIESLLGISE